MPFPSLAKVKRYFICWFEGTNAIFSPGPAGLSFSNRRSHSNSEPLLTLAIRLKMGAKQPPGASWAPPVAQPGNIVCPRAPPTADVTHHVWSARAKHAIYEKHPGLDKKNIQVDMDLACDPDKTAFAISSLIHGPDLL